MSACLPGLGCLAQLRSRPCKYTRFWRADFEARLAAAQAEEAKARAEVVAQRRLLEQAKEDHARNLESMREEAAAARAAMEEEMAAIEAEALRLAGQCDARLARGTGSPGRVMGGLALQTA